MHFITKAIVLQNIKYAESSVICKLLTERFGVISYIINGVRSTKGKNKASILQPSSILEIEATQRDNKNIQRLSQFKLAYTFSTIPFDIRKSSMAQLMIELLNKTLHPNEANHELFEFVLDSLCFLDETKRLNPDFHLMFMIKLTSYLGFQPNGTFTTLTPLLDLMEGAFVSRALSGEGGIGLPYSKFIADLMHKNFTDNTPILSNSEDRNTLLNYLIQYYKYHIDSFSGLKSPEVLKAVFD